MIPTPLTPFAAAVLPSRTAYPEHRHTLPRAPGSVAVARTLASRALADWGLDGTDAAETALLLVSELVTNALRHTERGLVRVIIDRPEPDEVYIGVVDRTPGLLPVRRLLDDVPDTEETGRGLFLVDVLSGGRWGYILLGPEPRWWGKCVWGQVATTTKADSA